MNLQPQTVSALQSFNTLQHQIIFHPSKLWCISRRRKSWNKKKKKKSSKVFSTCTHMNIKLFYLSIIFLKSTQFNWQDLYFFFFLIIDSLHSRATKATCQFKVPKKNILVFMPFQVKKKAMQLLGFIKFGILSCGTRFITTQFLQVHTCQSAVNPKLQRQYIMPAESSHVSEIGSYFCTVFRQEDPE